MSRWWLYATKLTENDLVAFFPHLGNERFARIDRPCKADFDIFPRSKRLEDVFSRKAEEAETLTLLINLSRIRHINSP